MKSRWLDMLRVKNATLANFLLAAGSVLVCIVFIEIWLRQTTFPSATQFEQASKKWYREHWHPINSLGYRDAEPDEFSTKSKIAFLGDSLTAGYGVKYDQTYYYKVREHAGGDFQFVNLGIGGSATRQQTVALDTFTAKYPGNLHTVIHQYLGNDIEDYFSKELRDDLFTVKRSLVLKALISVSEIAAVLDSYLSYSSFGQRYIDTLFAHYEKPETLRAHLADLHRLHQKIWDADANLVILLFPFLNNDEIIARSSDYGGKIKAYFRSNCRTGDALIDVTPIVKPLSPSGRVVGPLDAHPSVLVNSKVADALNRFLAGETDHVLKCSK